MKKNISKSTRELLDKLNFTDSDSLYLISELNKISMSSHNKKVLKEINPIAFFCIDKEPFVLFFENINTKKELRAISKKIWNAQIPVAIVNNSGNIITYNGKRMTKEKELKVLLEQPLKEITDESDFAYWNITNQSFWSRYKDEYSGNELNESLLTNLEYMTGRLENDYGLEHATKLILRIIFIRYLIDRGINIGYMGLDSNIKESQTRLLEIVQDKNELYNLFDYLKYKMNGNLFDMSLESDMRKLNDQIFLDLKDFLSGEIEQKTGQLCLFPLYDFNIIPVELISNMYEVLLGEESQKRDKAFYTPSYLVDYILDKTIDNHLESNRNCRVLDPSCGSGIFLVQTYKRIIDKNIKSNQLSYKELNKLLEENIYGIDRNEDAINVTIFSLYIVILDYAHPKDLNNIRFPDLLNQNLIVSDFFNCNLTNKVTNLEFDYILGNPPWGNMKNKYVDNYRKEHNYQAHRNEISTDFLIKAGNISTDSTICCFVVPSKIFYNTQKLAVEFRQYLLKEFNVQTVIELSSVRELLFKRAKGPATIIIYKKGQENKDDPLEHISLKPNIFFKLFNIIVQEKGDIKYVDKILLQKYDYLWKILVYGTVYDFYIIKSLLEKYDSISDIINRENLMEGTGVLYYSGKKSAEHLLGRPLLDSKNTLEHFFINKKNVTEFNKKKIHRVRNELLFEAPLCLFRAGVNTHNYKIRAAFLDEDLVYKKAFNGIKGEKNNKYHEKILKNLVGLLNSSLYAYLNLMTSSDIGIEREQLTKAQVLGYPYLFDEQIVKMVECIEDSLKNKYYVEENMKHLVSSEEIEKLMDELDVLILELFGLEDNPFIDYAINIQIPEITGYKEVNKIVNKNDMLAYSNVFIEYWKDKLKLINKDYRIKIYNNIKDSYTIFEMGFIDKESDNYKIEFISDNQVTDIDINSKFMINKINDKFYQVKDIVNFEENSFYIIKSNNFKNWHPSRAYIDLYEVVQKVLKVSKEGE